MVEREKFLERFKEKIRNYIVIVLVIGLGYVGLFFVVEKVKVGFLVIGIE